MHKSFEETSCIRVVHREVPPIKEGETQLHLHFTFRKELELPGFPTAPSEQLQRFIKDKALKCFGDCYSLQDELNGTLVAVGKIDILMTDPETGAVARSIIEPGKIQYI